MKRCHLCQTTLRPIINQATKVQGDSLACEHCDMPCKTPVAQCAKCLSAGLVRP